MYFSGFTIFIMVAGFMLGGRLGWFLTCLAVLWLVQ